jgi:hypothetical protein
LTSEQKLKEARFFLDEISKNYQDDEKCEYCLSAFLHASYDLIDHTLEEYRQHFKLDIPTHERNRLKRFIEIASEATQADAIGFIRLYLTELQKIYTSPVCAPLLIIRNSNTHNQTNLTPFSTFTEYADGRRDFDRRYFLASHDLVLPYFRNDLEGYVCVKTKKIHKLAKLAGIDLSFASLSDLGDIYKNACNILSSTDVRNVCKKYLELLEEFVKVIRSSYPRW